MSTAAAESRFPQKSIVREYFETIVVFVLILLFARTFVFMQSKIPTKSMLETLLVGDYIFVNRMLYGGPGDAGAGLLGQDEIERGDVIVFRWPNDPDLDFVKRVIGMPGETVEMRDGYVYVDGTRLDEPYVLAENRDGFTMSPRRIPEGHYFMLGDNRDESRDSRSWGTVPRSLIKGRAFFIWYSFDEQENDHERVGVDRLKSMARKVIFFPTKTRWSRLFSQIE